jgi:FKBP-type peptidyl-prolyl cis-trans isomerase
MHGGPVPFEHRPEEPGKPISLGSRWDTLDWSRFEHRPASEPSQKTPRVLTAQALVPAVDGVAGTDSAEVHAERDAAVEQPALPEPDRSWRVDVSGLRWQQVTPPMVDDAPAATAGRFAVIHFEATTLDARPIASTREGQPVGFVLWAGQTMQALDVGVVGMRIGERRRLVAPRGLLDAASPASTEPTEPAMLEDGAPLPADAVVLDVELVDVRPGIDVQVQRSAGGVPAFPGDRVQFHYAGRLAEDGRVFQDSREHGGPMTVHLGDGSLIAGLELGLIGAAEGEVRDVRIPPHLAYGRRGWGSIVPGGASVIYRVEVIRVEPALQMSGTP